MKAILLSVRTVKGRSFLLFLLLALPLFARSQDIAWSKDRPLTWDDFKAVPDEGRKAGATTYSRISYQFVLTSKDTAYHFNFRVSSLFNSDRSWVKKKYKNKLVLQHEQLHFDINEFYARMLYDEFTKAVYTDNYRAEIEKIYNDLMALRNSAQKKYDEDVSNGNTEMQMAWNKQIKEGLEKGSADH